MNKLLTILVAAALFAGCATTDGGNEYTNIKPTETKGEAPSAVAWQNKHNDELMAATKPEVLVTFVESPERADALLAKIGPAYKGDPLTLTQIAAVSELVMCPKCPKAPTFRKTWVAALERAKAAAKDEYVKTFCAQQLWWCGYAK